jgi:hypothetical protein
MAAPAPDHAPAAAPALVRCSGGDGGRFALAWGDRPILAVPYGADDRPDPVLAALADACGAAGMRLAGLVQRGPAVPPGSRCNMEVELLPTGRRLAISEERGAGARGCRLDPGLLLDALAAAGEALEADAELFILNRFGKVEADGGGGRWLIARAVELGVPVVLAVPWRNIAAFRAFAGELATEVPVEQLATVLASARPPAEDGALLQPRSPS